MYVKLEDREKLTNENLVKLTEGFRILAISNSYVTELNEIFTKLGIKPVWVGAIGVGLITKPITTGDFDILISKDDFVKLKRGCNNDLVFKGSEFKYKGEQLETKVEGEPANNYKFPSPDDVRGVGFYPSPEGLILMKLMRLYLRDREHMARIVEMHKIDENKLETLINKYGDNKLRERWKSLKQFWELGVKWELECE